MKPRHTLKDWLASDSVAFVESSLKNLTSKANAKKNENDDIRQYNANLEDFAREVWNRVSLNNVVMKAISFDSQQKRQQTRNLVRNVVSALLTRPDLHDMALHLIAMSDERIDGYICYAFGLLPATRDCPDCSNARPLRHHKSKGVDKPLEMHLSFIANLRC